MSDPPADRGTSSQCSHSRWVAGVPFSLPAGIRSALPAPKAVAAAYSEAPQVPLAASEAERARRSGGAQPSTMRHARALRLAKSVELVEGAVAALDHRWDGLVASVTYGDLEHVEDLCCGEHRRPLPADQVEDSRP